MKLINVTEQFSTQDKCLEYIEKMRWPHGVACIHCGVMNVSTITRKTEGDNKRNRIYQCLEKECGKQFSATSGTIFNDTHLPLTKWFMAIALICEAKKGISAKQVERHLGVNYRTAWHLCHRIREAMQEGGLLEGIVETDETYMSRRKPRKGKPYVKKENTDVVLGMIERGGKLRLIPVANAKMASIEPEIKKHVSSSATLQTDESAVYTIIGKRHFDGRHRMINHIKSYAEGENHTNSIENAFSLLKRGVYGTYHKVSIKHLGRYCNEFSYRFNRREEQADMFDATLKNLTRGEALPFKKLTASRESEA
ncbi:MAG TPA: IS1595 family transposase [Candidatus Saccharimonadales bacterium]|jgi:transposase-like protein|nr:IS1595 family transposase [Candidatus Saccharimonadales bacterium]